MSTNRLVKRIEKTIKDLSPGREALKSSLTRIGLLVSAQTSLNIRREGLIDTGRLINSIRYELYQDGDTAGVLVGSFGVPYAAVHEFGFKGNVNVRAHQRLVRNVFGKSVTPHKIEVRQHSRKMNIRAKFYLRNAVKMPRWRWSRSR